MEVPIYNRDEIEHFILHKSIKFNQGIYEDYSDSSYDPFSRKFVLEKPEKLDRMAGKSICFERFNAERISNI
ncbi:hypothetical protein LEP1GSC171_2475 [Leptospira santarosai str. HAI1380]|nr:hypothetical protein LEP1GSC039_0958 [Leptospira santarosai str. 2000027870]EMP03907.1 hypothetical protein LEP1GSC171_2475 [Leptospira santarosai str. HAI1380]KXZ27456.1 hypothetical protein AYB33_17990 [Leptospira santarosai]